MKTLAASLIVLLALGSAACQVERTSEGTEVVTDTAATAETREESREVARESREETSEAGQELREGASDLVESTETALREGVRQTGTALEKAGQELQQHSKPGNQP